MWTGNRNLSKFFRPLLYLCLLYQAFMKIRLMPNEIVASCLGLSSTSEAMLRRRRQALRLLLFAAFAFVIIHHSDVLNQQLFSTSDYVTQSWTHGHSKVNKSIPPKFGWIEKEIEAKRLSIGLVQSLVHCICRLIFNLFLLILRRPSKKRKKSVFLSID